MIRLMQNSEHEINKVMGIWQEAAILGHPFIERSYWEDNYDMAKNDYLPVAKNYVYVNDDEKIRGFISVIPKHYIGALFIEPDYQNRGIGKELLDYVVDKYKVLELAVYKQNERAVNFYKRYGFQISELRINEDTNQEEYEMYIGDFKEK